MAYPFRKMTTWELKKQSRDQLKGGVLMAYTPELSYKSSCTLRRIAWALDIPMTQAIEMVFEYVPTILDRNKVCQGCRDKTRCDDCSFNYENISRKEEICKN
jgi:hypothetical protein